MKEIAYQVWREMMWRRRRKFIAWGLAVAASFMFATVMGPRLFETAVQPPAGEGLATADKVSGTISIRTGSGPASPFAVGAQGILAGQTLRTGMASGLGLRWSSGEFLRLDEFTEVELVSVGEIVLHSGRLYVDSRPLNATSSRGNTRIAIKTPHGWVRHVGTQFMTRVTPTNLLISVRGGKVLHEPVSGRRDPTSLVNAGEQLTVEVDGTVAREAIVTWGAPWQWTEALSTPFQSEGRSVADLLAWVARETGRKVDYQSPEAIAAASATVLHGGPALELYQAITVLTATSDLRAEVTDGVIVVWLRSAE